MRNETRKLSALKPLERNPRKISDDEMNRLMQSIKDNPDYFEARPIILSDRTGELVILAGNQRYYASKKLGLKEVPTFLLSGLTEEQEREIIIRDNVSNGEWDMDLLANEWSDLPLDDWGVNTFEFPTQEANDEADEGNENVGTLRFIMSSEQQEVVKTALRSISEITYSTYGNENGNGNKLYQLIKEWEAKKASEEAV